MHAWLDGSSYGVGAVNYGPPHGVDGWSMSDGTASFACVSLGGFPHCFGCVAAFSQMKDGMCGLFSHRLVLSCWCFEKPIAMWRG